VLDPDTVYEARLIPLLLREGFRNYEVNASAHGPSGKLGRWEVHDEGDSNTPSKWEVREAGTPPAPFLRQTRSIKGGADDAADPFKPGTMLVFGNDPALDVGTQRATVQLDRLPAKRLSERGQRWRDGSRLSLR
jgi:hypothetical protein